MKQYNRVRMDMKGKASQGAVLCMGIAVFALALYFFGLRTLVGLGVFKVLLRLILPMTLCVAFIVLIKILRWNAPGLYGILGAAFSVVLLADGFFAGGILTGILCGILLLVAGVGILAISGGFLPASLPIGLLYPLTIFLRMILTVKKAGLKGFILELGVYAMLTGLMLLSLAMKPIPLDTEE